MVRMVIFVARKRNKKIVKYHKPFQINIGVVIFVFIFLYLTYYVFSYFTSEQISVYEVKQGTIAQNTVFQGLILRDETVYYAQESGYVNYYCRNGSKAGVGNYVYSVDETGDFYHEMTASNEGQLMLSDESYEQLAEVTEQYLAAYSDYNFGQVYQFKYDMEATLAEALNYNAAKEIGVYGSGTGNSTKTAGLHIYTADAAGVVVYYTDGLEDVTSDTFTADMLDELSYQKENFLKRETVAAGEAVYKMITSEYWQVVIPIEDSLAADLAEEENIKVEFKKDNTTAWAASQIITKDGDSYLLLEFKNSMIRFAADRFIELELLITDTSGLKIPNSAITTKEFFTVPKDYVTKGGDSNNNGLLIERVAKSGDKSISFIETSLFYETEEVYYIDSDEIQIGDIAIRPDSNERFTLQHKESLEGVYNINKGYAVFKRIEKLFENEEYTIIKTGTTYGLSLYDHIALNSSTINEDDIIH